MPISIELKPSGFCPIPVRTRSKPEGTGSIPVIVNQKAGEIRQELIRINQIKPLNGKIGPQIKIEW